MDKYIIGESSSGKTRKMLEAAKENGAVIICKHPLHMQEKANAYGIYGLEFYRYDDIGTEDVRGKKIAIDELTDFFHYCYGTRLDSFTMTIKE